MAEAILRYLRKGLVESTFLLGDDEIEVIHFRIPDAAVRLGLVGKPIKTLGFPKGALVGAVIRGDEALIGSGDTILRPGDELLIVCQPEALARVERLLS
jgi:trk system potassium uptake protein TrkA